MNRLLTVFISKLVKPFIRYYISKPRRYRYKDVQLIVLPGVFHPRFFFGSKLLVNHLSGLDLRGLSFLELGSGSGLISLFAAKKGAAVMACDISKTAVANTLQNQALNGLSFPVVQSDLFADIPSRQFDVIAINPPYYKKKPLSEADHAWYCGENSEYFLNLFSSLRPFIHSKTQVIMVLSDVCDIDLIKSIAGSKGFDLNILSEHQLPIEKNFIFSIEAIAA